MSKVQFWVRLGGVVGIGALPLLIIEPFLFHCQLLCPTSVWGGLTLGLVIPLAVGIAAGLLGAGWQGWLALAVGTAIPATVWAFKAPFPDPPQDPGQMIGFFLGWTLIPATIGYLTVRGLISPTFARGSSTRGTRQNG